MTRLILFITTLLFCQSVFAQTFEQLIYSRSLTKPDTTKFACKIFTNTGDRFCSSSIAINSNHTYTEEAGCEGRSNTSFGLWRNINDSIIELYQDTTLFIIAGVTITDEIQDNCDYAKIKILDAIGQPVAGFSISLLTAKYKKDKNLSLLYRNPENQGEQLFQTNENGELRLALNNYDSLRFNKFRPFLNCNPVLTTKSLVGKSILFRLNIHRLGLAYSDINFTRLLKSTKIKIANKKLVYLDYEEPFILDKELID